MSVRLQKPVVVLCNHILFHSRVNPYLDSLRLLVCCGAHFLYGKNLRNLLLQFVLGPIII